MKAIIEVAALVVLTSTYSSSAQTCQVVHSFTWGSGGGAPGAGLVMDGSTMYGTVLSAGKGGNGTLFKLNTDGSGFTNLHSFSWSDGANPGAGLVVGDGVLYGTTGSGGDWGSGTVFAMNTDGSGYKVLRSFDALSPAYTGTNHDGAKPLGDLLLDGSMLYGTTLNGGSSGEGTIFKVATDGSGFDVLRSFSALSNNTNSDGANPRQGLVLSEGLLYGTTFYGGSFSNGTIFKLDTEGNNFSVVKHFPATISSTNTDGANPWGPLLICGSTLYGTAHNGGNMGVGTIFKLLTDGTGYTVLRSFGYYDGAWPYSGLLLNGNTLYGTTITDGTSRNGTVFKINTEGTDYRVLKYFTNSPDGSYPEAGLLLTGSTLFGTTYYGGSAGVGVVFALTVAPEIQVNDASLGVRTNHFGFNVTGVSNQVVVVEACTNLSFANWVSLETNSIGAGPLYFSDPVWISLPARFYRVRSQ